MECSDEAQCRQELESWGTRKLTCRASPAMSLEIRKFQCIKELIYQVETLLHQELRRKGRITDDMTPIPTTSGRDEKSRHQWIMYTNSPGCMYSQAPTFSGQRRTGARIWGHTPGHTIVQYGSLGNRKVKSCIHWQSVATTKNWTVR